jgi:hypothetical protein
VVSDISELNGVSQPTKWELSEAIEHARSGQGDRSVILTATYPTTSTSNPVRTSMDRQDAHLLRLKRHVRRHRILLGFPNESCEQSRRVHQGVKRAKSIHVCDAGVRSRDSLDHPLQLD